jgi:hypothetical protein
VRHTHILINLDEGVMVGVISEEAEHDWDNDNVVDFYMNLSHPPAQD